MALRTAAMRETAPARLLSSVPPIIFNCRLIVRSLPDSILSEEDCTRTAAAP